MLHGVQGAYYWKQFGKHGALHNPYAYGYFDHVPHKDLHGGHVTVGGIVYQGDSFPPSFAARTSPPICWATPSTGTSCTRAARRSRASLAGDLLLANDTWFAPSDVTMGPDGAVYVCDWHDQRTAHPDPDAEWDRTNGRIYRIKASGIAPQAGDAVDSLAEQATDRRCWPTRTTGTCARRGASWPIAAIRR